MQGEEQTASWIRRALSWIRGNAGVISMTVVVLTFLGGIGGWIVLTTKYFSTLATTQHVTDTVNEAVKPLDETVDSLNETVDGLSDLATKDDVTDAVSEAVKPLDESVDSLNETVDGLSETVARLEGTLRGWEISIETLSGTVQTLNGTVQTLNGTVQTLSGKVDGLDDSLDALNVTFPLFMSCVMELHGPWAGGGVDTWGDRPAPSLDSFPNCREARELVNSLVASGR